MNNCVPFKAGEGLDLMLNVVCGDRLVDKLDIAGVDSVKLEDVVVYKHEGIVHRGAIGTRSVGEHGNLGRWRKFVAQVHGTSNCLGKLRCCCGLAVAGEGDHIG